MKIQIATLILCAFVCSCSDTQRSDKPLEPDETNLELPTGAYDVYYLTHAEGMQIWESYIRFDMPAESLDGAVEELIKANSKFHGEPATYDEKHPLSKLHLMIPRKEFLPMVWWTPESVTTGYFKGDTDGLDIVIVVDTDKSRVFVYQSH